MYKLSRDNFEYILTYSELYGSTVYQEDCDIEISKVNMNKAISIICELISLRGAKISFDSNILGMVYNIKVPFEGALKKMYIEIENDAMCEYGRKLIDPLNSKNNHIISLQGLLLLLKRVLVFGNRDTMAVKDYLILKEDYVKIIKWGLITSQCLNDSYLDLQHYIYANYHTGYVKNPANSFLRTYYMFERLLKHPELFKDDIRKEYRDYNASFKEKYGYSIMEYISVLFWNLGIYHPEHVSLSYSNCFCEINQVYKNTKLRDVANPIIKELASTVDSLYEWSSSTLDSWWDFDEFLRKPFILVNNEYISISDKTLCNTFMEKLYGKIIDCYPKTEKECMSFYGRLFEKYVQDITKNAISNIENYEFIDEFKYNNNGKDSSDAYIKFENKLIIVESKSYAPFMSSISRAERLEESVEKVIIKPIKQADETFYNIMKSNEKEIFNDINETYIISVTMDNINAVPAYYESAIYEIEKNKKSELTHYMFNFNIEEYELLLGIAEQQKDIFQLLKNYFDNQTLEPFINIEKQQISDEGLQTKYMNEIYQEATKLMCSLYGIM